MEAWLSRTLRARRAGRFLGYAITADQLDAWPADDLAALEMAMEQVQ